jgi:hypothetical protein
MLVTILLKMGVLLCSNLDIDDRIILLRRRYTRYWYSVLLFFLIKGPSGKSHLEDFTPETDLMH